MKIPFRVPFLLIGCVICGHAVAAQNNNPFSANPESRGRQTAAIARSTPQLPPDAHDSVAEARRTAFDNSPRPGKPTDIYKVAAGDVLYVTLANTNNAGGYYSVRQDGTIDFPLAGGARSVQGMTIEEIEQDLAARITLFSDPNVRVRVREYGSHKVQVTGAVAHKGERSLQREALPLFVIRADAAVDPSATKVLIRRTDTAKIETYALNDHGTDDVLVYPGDTVEFATDDPGRNGVEAGFFYIAGEINNMGQRGLAKGMTLMQAMIASGGAKSGAKKAFIRRKTEKGTLNVAEYDLKKIRDGKAADPVLDAGDMIEITN